ncbi:MAG: hypothetical protein ACD_3C00024G0002 [uncultured bacterium (gcode 4)]|uniref:Uncharacterized protein n=1 Tax=uncultured bacterium (gcode 4) TaxID=1234023 RepID=K2GZ41_9BACT|nr:MAG: hypothetical protein ACD_3C00024G0002 [uncultured bacterium (gcode 4)]
MKKVDSESDVDLVQIQKEANRLASGSRSIKAEVNQILSSDIWRLNKIIACGIFFKRKDYLKKALEEIWDGFDSKWFALKYSKNILDFFNYLAKWRNRLTAGTDSWFSWFVEIDWMYLLYKTFWKHMNLEKKVRAVYSDMLVARDSYFFARKMYSQFSPDMDLTYETKKWFDNFISKTTFNYLDISLIIYKDFSSEVDFTDEIIKNKSKIISFFRRAWKNQDIERLAGIMNNYWKYFDLNEMKKEVFLDLLKTSYNKSLDFWKFVKDDNVSAQVKKWFSHRFAQKEFKIAKQIVKDFWAWIDFKEEILSWIAFLKTKWIILNQAEVLRDFSS